MPMLRPFALASLLGVALCAPAAVRAASCFPIPTPTANAPALTGSDTATVLAAINAQHMAEAIPGIAPIPGYEQLPPEQQVLVLINAERASRNLPAYNSGNAALSGNDFYLGYEASNHSRLIAAIPALYFASPHDTSIEGLLEERLGAVPNLVIKLTAGAVDLGSSNVGHVGEIMNVATTAARAVYVWMYQDANPLGGGTPWGHRNNILDACYTYAGSGVAPATSVADVAAFGPSALLFTVDFVESNTFVQNGQPYKPVATTPPTPPGPIQQGTLSLTGAPGGTAALSLSLSYSTSAAQPNGIRTVQVYQNPPWGQPVPNAAACPPQPDGSAPPNPPCINPVFGSPPFGLGAIPCPVTDGGTGTASCSLSFPAAAAPNPVVVIALDRYDFPLILQSNLSQ